MVSNLNAHILAKCDQVMELANEDHHYISVNSVQQTVGTVIQKIILQVEYQPRVCLLMITWHHGLISSSKNSYGTKCVNDFFVLGAVHGGNFVRKECIISCLLVLP